MRLLLGMILGALITIGAAYVADTSVSTGPEQRPMVNWDVVGRNFDNVKTVIKQGWTKLTG